MNGSGLLTASPIPSGLLRACTARVIIQSRMSSGTADASAPKPAMKRTRTELAASLVAGHSWPSAGISQEL